MMTKRSLNDTISIQTKRRKIDFTEYQFCVSVKAPKQALKQRIRTHKPNCSRASKHRRKRSKIVFYRYKGRTANYLNANIILKRKAKIVTQESNNSSIQQIIPLRIELLYDDLSIINTPRQILEILTQRQEYQLPSFREQITCVYGYTRNVDMHQEKKFLIKDIIDIICHYFIVYKGNKISFRIHETSSNHSKRGFRLLIESDTHPSISCITERIYVKHQRTRKYCPECHPRTKTKQTSM